MRSLLLIVIPIICCLPPLKAAVLYYQFEATFSNDLTYDPIGGLPANYRTAAVTGIFSYDTTLTPTPGSPPSELTIYTDSTPTNTFNVYFDGVSAFGFPDVETDFFVYNDKVTGQPNNDGFGLVADYSSGIKALVILDTFRNDIRNDTDLPMSLEYSDYDEFTILQITNQSTNLINFQITSLSQVPEPSSYLLFLFGSLLAIFGRRNFSFCKIK